MASSSAAMKMSLVFMLLLGAAVAAQGRKVTCENKCPKPMWVCGKEVGPGLTVDVDVRLDVLDFYFYDHEKVKRSGSFHCPADVKAVVMLYDGVCVKVKVAALGLISGLLHTVLYSLLGLVKGVL